MRTDKVHDCLSYVYFIDDEFILCRSKMKYAMVSFSTLFQNGGNESNPVIGFDFNISFEKRYDFIEDRLL